MSTRSVVAAALAVMAAVLTAGASSAETLPARVKLDAGGGLYVPFGVGRAMCCPVLCYECSLVSRGQLNHIVMDRGAGRVRMIPNIRFTGTAEDFALVVPTPTVPDLTPVDRQIWTEVARLTAPIAPPRNFASAELEVPLGILAVNRAPDMPVDFFVLDDHRTELPGFATTHANRISAEEFASIQAGYPTLAGQLAAGR